MARRARRFLAEHEDVALLDAVFAECVFVLESVYKLGRSRIAELLGAMLGTTAMKVLDERVLLRSLTIYADTRLDYVDAYVVAAAEMTSKPTVASFDRGIDRVPGVERIEP